MTRAAVAMPRRALAATITLAIVLAMCGPSAASGSASPSTARSRPRVLEVVPHIVAGKGGTRILVLGRGFTASTRITVGGKRARVLDVRNPGAVFAEAPPGIGTEIVRAATRGGTSASNTRSLVRFDTSVLIVGDSLGIDLGWGFTPTLDAHDRLAVTDDAVGSTGLVRSDYYDWPAHLRDDIAHTHPDVVVTLFGTNDDQSLETPRGRASPGTPAWDAAYSARVRQIASIVREARATLVWVGLPRMGPRTQLNQVLVAHLVDLDRAVVAMLPQATFVNAWLVFTAPSGAYTPWVEVAPHVWALGHSSDDTHLTTAGAVAIDARAVVSLRELVTRH